MKMKIELELKTVDHGSLEDFLSTAPRDAELSVDVRIVEPDRPGETRRGEATLIAEWNS